MATLSKVMGFDKNIYILSGKAFLLFILLSNVQTTNAQGINFPVGNPVGTSGAGNARTDADNYFLRNNVAGMTEIPGRENASGMLRGWRFNGEIQLATYQYRRERLLPGPNQGTTTKTRLGTPGLASEITYTSASQRYAFGFGTYTIFGFQSKLEDPPTLGARATFFDTRVASNDFTAGGSVRLHPRLSIGASFIAGRGFVDLARPTQALALAGRPGQDRLDVEAWGAPGASIGLHFRPIDRLSFGINFKTRRRYDLEGTLETFAPVPGTTQFIPVRPEVRVKFRPPAIAEGGLEVRATRWLRVFGDFRYYDYSATFQQIDVINRASNQPITSLRLDAYDVRSVRTGALIELNRTTILQAGWAFTSRGFPNAAISPGTINPGGFDISGGVIRRVTGDAWINIGVAAILARNRDIGPPENVLFPGRYGGIGAMLGVGLRW